MLNDVSVWWHVIGVIVIVGALILVPASHQSVSTVFSKTMNDGGFSHTWLWFVAPTRTLAGSVHVYGLRRLGAHETRRRRTPREPQRKASSCRSSSRRSSATSLLLGRDLRDPELRRNDRRRAVFAVKQVYLDALELRHWPKVMLFIAVVRAVLLRDELDHVSLADDVRVLA